LLELFFVPLSFFSVLTHHIFLPDLVKSVSHLLQLLVSEALEPLKLHKLDIF
jgi:hypothetical protein